MPIAGLLYAVAQFQTNAGLSLKFIRQRAFKLFIGGLLIARGPRCHFVLDEGLIEIERLSREQGIFHTCTTSTFILHRQNTLHAVVPAQLEAPAASAHCWFAAWQLQYGLYILV